MNLSRIKVEFFCGLESVDMDLTAAKVNIILGAGRSGKSSVRDAVKWGLSALCRGIRLKKDARMLGLHGKPPKVSLTIDGDTLVRTPLGVNCKESELVASYGSPELLAAVVDAFDMVTLKPQDRADLVRALSADGQKIADATAKELTKCGVPADGVKEVSTLAGTNIDKAEESAVNKRRAAKHKLDGIPAAKPPASVEVAGVAWELDKSTVADIEANAGKIREERTKLEGQLEEARNALAGARAAESPELLAKRVEENNAKLNALGGVDAKAEQKAAADVTKLRKERDQALADYNQAKGAKEAAGANYARTEKLKGKCPTCGHKMKDEERATLLAEIEQEGNVAGENMSLAEARGKEVAPKLDAAEKRLAEVKKAVYDCEALRLENAALRQRAKEALEAGNIDRLTKDMERVQAEIVEADKRLAVGAELLKAKQTYDAAVALFNTRAGIDAEILAWDKAQKVLGTDGPIRRMASAAFDLAAVNRHVAALLPGGRVEKGSDWSLTYHDEARGTRPVELCSRSEKFLLGSAFAAALSLAAGIKLLILDEADIVVDDTETGTDDALARSNFMAWLLAIAGQFDRVLVMATRGSREGLVPVEGVTWWWVKNGRAELALAPQAVAP